MAGLSAAGCPLFDSGPCYHTYEDPVLVVREVRGLGGVRLPVVIIDHLAFNGRPTDLAFHARDMGFNVAIVPEGLQCTLPCGLATIEGLWTLGFVAPGYQPKEVQVNARYKNFDGGCPSSNSGPTEIAVQLDVIPTSSAR
jgi:hypothetical protein